jgi:hypothetical protein
MSDEESSGIGTSLIHSSKIQRFCLIIMNLWGNQFPFCQIFYLGFAQVQFVSHGIQEIRIASVLEKCAKSLANKKQITSIFFVNYAQNAIALLVQKPKSQRLRPLSFPRYNFLMQAGLCMPGPSSYSLCGLSQVPENILWIRTVRPYEAPFRSL